MKPNSNAGGRRWRLLCWRPGRLAAGTLLMSLAMGARTIGQGLVFLIVARVLGTSGYGAYAAVLALAATMGTFAGMGSSTLMVRDVARDPSTFGVAWGNTVASLAVTAPMLLALYGMFAWAVLPVGITWLAIIFIGLAEIVCMPFTLACMNAYQGHERIGRAAKLLLLPIAPRVIGVLCLLVFTIWVSPPNLLGLWAVLYFAASLTAAIYLSFLVRRDLDRPILPSLRMVVSVMRRGAAYAVGGSSLKLYADADKIMLARLADLAAAGAYSAGYRVVDLVVIPLHALLMAGLPRFFKMGAAGKASMLKYGLRLLPVPLLYAVLAGVTLFWLAGWLPVIMGNQYQAAVDALKWLCWLPLVSLPRLLTQNLLIGADRERAAVAVLVAGAAVNILLNLWFIPLWNWKGAVLATYASEIGMTVLLLGLMIPSGRRKSGMA
ncbi:hypothetical protein BI364_14435 [Acidihalobacter yilgarnensis]|uniref:Uncharacterized protein n=1 Tax=Acidihalobacter yilgarnensis TaxID=2819280 RepID=A0A1D8IR75_9GAMM|nr:oligosaccharide flippase family protein [Acidihalobacter yilgarnensis]AOU98991.1 hypothetical protein BI364_14435 [Acidihalobacter yilgarnensis]